MTAPIKKSVSNKVVICEPCQGTGLVRREELEDYHRNEYRVWTEPCPRCEGQGRVLEETTVQLLRLVPEDLRSLAR